ncbi:MAG: potassium channel protein, partial [Candidatus Latescibacteria bacterium]|nr:potassium channel protein [Candidatus Latescibacterota bacterium]
MHRWRRSFLRGWRFIWRNRYATIAVLTLVVMFSGATIVWMLEPHDPPGPDNFSTFGNALWWSIVTIVTVGYGDIAPDTPWGRLAASFLMITGVGIISVLTATIASLLTEQRLREARGLEQVKSKGHIVICGWSPHLEKILDGFMQMKVHEKREIVLINDLPEERMQQFLLKYEEIGLKYVKGDFVQEAVLRRANAQEAHSAIVLASRENQEKSPDERTLIATLAIKNLRPDIKVCAEITEAANEQHLRIADADDIIVSGEHTGFLLASAA